MCIPLKGIEGSNPSVSAFAHRSFSVGGFRFVGFGGRSPQEISSFFLVFNLCLRSTVCNFWKKKLMWTVYILKCFDGSFYTGCTNDITDRLNRHNKGQVKYTSTRLPIILMVTINFYDKYKAYNFESYLKSGSGKAFMNKRLI